MSCNINLFNRIPSENNQTITGGGTWSLDASSNPITGIRTIYTSADSLPSALASALGNSTPTSFAAGAPITGTAAGTLTSSQYLWIDPNDIPVGTYKFRYTVSDPNGSCTDFSILTINIKAGVKAGKTAGATYCSTDTTAHSLFSLFPVGDADNSPSHGPCTGTSPTYPCGVFSGTGTDSDAYDSTNRTFTPSLATPGVTYSFNYTVGYGTSDTSQDTGCTSGYCIESTTFSIKVVETGYAGQDKTISLCNKP